MSKRKTEQDYIDLAKQRNMEWVGKSLPKTVSTRTEWKCEQGHIFNLDYSNLMFGRNCQHCSKRARKTKQDYHKLAESRLFNWVGEFLPRRTIDKTLWRCMAEHNFESTYHKISHGRGCPFCSGRAKKTRGDYLRLASERNILWIGEFPRNIHKLTLWECLKGHQWSACYNNIVNGTNCPKCMRINQSSRQRLTHQDYHQIAMENGICWVGETVPLYTIDETEWKCDKGHVWKTCAHSIQAGCSCSICGNKVNGLPVSVQQVQIAKMIDGILNHKIGRGAIDIALPNKKIAIEYDGWYWHGNREKEDKERVALLNAQGWSVLSIKSGKKIPEENILLSHIEQLAERECVSLVLDDWGIGPCK